nr:NADH dehydrogenase subunit 4, mitochondrial [Tanacetum cinerariifolium]
GFTEFEFITSALAESVSDSDSEPEDEPILDKGKRKATDDEVRQQMGYSNEQLANEFETSSNNEKFIQEERDRVFAKTLQEEEDRAYAQYLQKNTEKVRSVSPSSDDYSVYSSEIHSDDSDNTRNKKLETLTSLKVERDIPNIFVQVQVLAHAAVYLMGSFSNSIQGIEGAIALGLGHGFVSSGLFICVGGVLYDRSHTRLITYYRGEFMCLYGGFERMPILGMTIASLYPTVGAWSNCAIVRLSAIETSGGSS